MERPIAQCVAKARDCRLKEHADDGHHRLEPTGLQGRRRQVFGPRELCAEAVNLDPLLRKLRNPRQYRAERAVVLGLAPEPTSYALAPSKHTCAQAPGGAACEAAKTLKLWPTWPTNANMAMLPCVTTARRPLELAPQPADSSKRSQTPTSSWKIPPTTATTRGLRRRTAPAARP